MSFSSPVILWLIAGAILCILEFTVPTAFVEFIMGISAIMVGLISLVVPQFGLQVVIWLILSVTLTVVSRRFMPKTMVRMVSDSTEAKVLTEIMPGKIGRVLYEGSSWQAYCEDDNIVIAPDEKVYVVQRKGNTLVVMPERFLQG
jgi:membrane protein implicated in regulation of membrane protease activity